MNCMLNGHVHTLGHIELTQFCRYTGDKLIMILRAIHSPEVETSSYAGILVCQQVVFASQVNSALQNDFNWIQLIPPGAVSGEYRHVLFA